MGRGEFNLDGHYIYYSEQESLRRSGVALIVNKSPKYLSSVTQSFLMLCDPLDCSCQAPLSMEFSWQ